MALRPIKFFLGGILLTLLCAASVQACFGPKLFVGTGAETEQEVLFALVTLYVQEKTGVESTRVDVTESQGPLDLLTGDKVDLVFMPVNDSSWETVLQLGGLPMLVSGPRPANDLQFTTVLPAITKLGRLLNKSHVELLASQVEAGDSAMSVVRKFLMENRWI